MRWRFHVCHIPGLKNKTCDTLSRYPWGDKPEETYINELSSERLDDYVQICSLKLEAVSWHDVQNKSQNDLEICYIMNLIKNQDYDLQKWKL